MALTVFDREPPMLPLAACWPATHVAADCAIANCGICGGGVADAAPAGVASEDTVAPESNAARPTVETPNRVRRMMCTVLASRTSTRKTPHQRGHPEPQSLCLDGGNSPDLEVSRLMASPRRCTIHGCGPAPESPRLPLSGSTASAIVLLAYGTTGPPPCNPPVPRARTIDGLLGGSSVHPDDGLVLHDRTR